MIQSNVMIYLEKIGVKATRDINDGLNGRSNFQSDIPSLISMAAFLRHSHLRICQIPLGIYSHSELIWITHFFPWESTSLSYFKITYEDEYTVCYTSFILDSFLYLIMSLILNLRQIYIQQPYCFQFYGFRCYETHPFQFHPLVFLLNLFWKKAYLYIII